jgi:hypothetical protein
MGAATRPNLRKTAALLRAAAASINRLAAHSLKKGKPVPWGTLTPPPPNTTLGRTPTPFSGGN